MRLTATKKGIYGFNLSAEVILACEPGESPFILLEEMNVCFTGFGHLFSVVCDHGSYAIRIDSPLQDYLSYVQEMVWLFFGTIDCILTKYKVGDSVPISDAMASHFYSILNSMLVIVLKTGAAQAGIGPDCYEYPTDIRLSSGSTMFS